MKKTYDIQDIKEYFLDLKLIEGKYAIRVALPSDWAIPSYDGILVGKHKAAPENGKQSYIVCNDKNENHGITDLVETVKRIESFNIDMGIKKAMLSEKVKELQKLFIEKSVEELKTLTISIGKKKGRPSNANKNKEEKEEVKSSTTHESSVRGFGGNAKPKVD